MSENTDINVDCQRIDERLADLIEDCEALDPELEAHLDRCDSCAAALTRAKRTAQVVGQLGDGFVLPADMVARVLAQVDDEVDHQRLPWHRAFSGWLTATWASVPGRLAFIGAGLAVAVWAVVSASSVDVPQTTPVASVPSSPVWAELLPVDLGAKLEQRRQKVAWKEIGTSQHIDLRYPLRTGPRSRARVKLPALGAELLLNQNTEVVVDRTGGRRRLKLSRGELVATVTKRKAGQDPLIFVVPTGKVHVLGTKFNLAASKALTTVDVIRGTVRVQDSGGAQALVHAGQEGVIPRSGGPRVALAPDLGRTVAWSGAARTDGPSSDPMPVGLGSLTARRPGRKGKGLPLQLADHDVKVRIQQGLARTEITETFHNPTRNTLEGTYRFPLPAGARISRLALYVGDRLEEGTIVERGRAAKIWRGVIRQATPKQLRKKKEEYIWVPGPWKDPALLQWRKGNQFELRIFPIPPRSSRKVILAYTESLPRTARGRRYVYPLPYSRDPRAQAKRFSVAVKLAGHDPAAPLQPSYPMLITRGSGGKTHHLAYEATDFAPTGDLVVDFATRESSSPLTVATFVSPEDAARGEAGYLQLALRPRLPAYKSDRPKDLLLLVDRSYSTLGEAGRRQLLLVESMVAEMDRRDRVAVLACDARCKLVAPWRRPSSDAARKLTAALARVRPGGATDLGQAVRAAALELRRAGDRRGRRPRVIYVGDGVPSVGELQTDKLVALVNRHLDPLKARLTTVGVGTDVDGSLLAALARAGSGSYVAFAPGTTAWGQALQVLARQGGVTLDNVKVALPSGVTRAAPRRIDTLHGGDELVLTARSPGRVEGQVVLTGKVNGEPFRAAFPVNAALKRSGGNAFVPRLWAQHTIEDLSAEGGAGHRQTVVALSKRHHLLSRYTSLLVLESAAMRRAFGVARGPAPVGGWTGNEAVQQSGLVTAGSGRGYGRGGGSLAGERVGDGHDPLAGLTLGGRTSSRSKNRGRRSRGTEDDLDSLVDSAVGKKRKRKSWRFDGEYWRDELGHYRRRSADSSAVLKGSGRNGGKRPRGGVTSKDRAQRLREGPRDRVPRVAASPPRAAVRGSLDSNVIRRVIRRNLRSIRNIYERQLRSNPNLVGRLNVRFTIGPNGSVIDAKVQSSTLNNRQVAQGITSAMRRWRFPRPSGGGVIHVVYPFVFRTSGGGVASRTDGVRGQGQRALPALPPLRRGRRWVRMKKVWYQDSTLTRMTRPGWRDVDRVTQREQDLADRPDSRDRHRRLYNALIRAGELDRGLRLAQDWLRREPHSTQALSLLAEAASRGGQHEQALRALGSIIDLEPRNERLHQRLAAKLLVAGQTDAACAHRISLAALAPADARRLQAAQDCRSGLTPRSDQPGLRGRIKLRGSWGSGEDLDLALVTSKGRRISWLSNRRGLTFSRVNSPSSEQLGVHWLRPGRYRVEVTRAAASDAPPVRGWVHVTAPGTSQRLPFRLVGKHTYVAELRIKRRSRLVPAPL
jgi:TonB family protein